MYYSHITSLKGLSCIFIVLGHFLGIVKYAEIIPFSIYTINILKSFRLYFLIDESFWLYSFFLISGYLIANSKIFSIKSFFIKCFFRFFRLGIPILFSSYIIFLIYKYLGFYNQKTICLFVNDWFQSSYNVPLSLFMVLLSPVNTLLSSYCPINPPYWVLKDMFLASILIYFCNYLKKYIQNMFAIYFFILLVLYFFSNIVFACFTGAILNYIEKYTINNQNSILYSIYSSNPLLIFVLSFLLCLLNSSIGKIIFFSVFIIYFPKIKMLNRLLENKIFIFLGKISFGIYAFHWPVICSIGAYLILYLNKLFTMKESYIISLAVSYFFSIIIAYIFYQMIEKTAYKFMDKIKLYLISKI